MIIMYVKKTTFRLHRNVATVTELELLTQLLTYIFNQNLNPCDSIRQ